MVSVRVVFGSSENMSELRDGSIALVVTSPPYYNAPFDFPGHTSMWSSGYMSEANKISRMVRAMNILYKHLKVIEDGE